MLSVVATVVWALGYAWATASDPDQDAYALALIAPVLVLLVPIAAMTVTQTVLRARAESSDDELALADPKRAAFIVWVFAFLVVLPFAGFVPASVLFFVGLAVTLGARSLPVLTSMTAFTIALLVGGFAWFLQIRLPLWLLPGFG